MADLKFSIVIPIYNAEATLRRCLDSLVGQQFSDYELLLINDGSTDDSDAICRKYANTYSCVRYFAKENGGVSSARNLGLEQAKGEYILFVDSDDYVADNYFAAISAAVKDTSPDLLLFGYCNLGDKSAEWSTGEFYESTETGVAKQVSSTLRRCLFSSLCNKVFKHDIIDEHRLGFKNDIYIGEDQTYVFEYTMNIKTMASINDILYIIDTGNDTSLSRKARPYLTEQLMEVNRRMYSAYRFKEHSPQAARCYETALSWMVYRSVYSSSKELLKFNYSSKQRRQKIRDICGLYNAENIKPIGWKCRLIALPVQMKLSWVIDWLINYKQHRKG